MLAKINRFNLSLLAIVGEGVLSRLSFGLVNLALPLYARYLGMSLAEIGILLSINTIVALALKPMCSWAIDRVGLKQSFIVAIGMRSLVPFMFAVAGTPWMLYITAAVHGLSKSVRDPSVDALIVEHGGSKTVASAFAWYSTAKSVSGSLGKGAAGILLTLTAANYFLVFVAACVISALSLIVVGRFVQGVRSQGRPLAVIEQAAGPSPSPQAKAPEAKNPRFLVSLLPFIGLGCFISGVGQMLDALFPILAIEHGGMNEAQVGILFMVATAVVLFAGPFMGWVSDHLSRKLVLLTAGMANAFASALYLLLPNLVGISGGKLVDDVGKTAFRPAWGAVLGQVSSVDRERRGRIVGYIGMGKDAGEIAGPILASLLWTFWGIPLVLGVRIALAIGAELYAFALLGRLKKLDSRQGPPVEEGARRNAGALGD